MPIPHYAAESSSASDDAIAIRLAESLAISKLPDRTGDSVIISHGVKVDILEGLWDESTKLGIIAHLGDFSRIDVFVVRVGQINLDGDLAWQVELRVERAGAVAGLDRCRRAEFVDPGRAGSGPVKTSLDAVARVRDLGEGEIDFSDDAGDVEAFDVADAAFVCDFEVWADAWLGRVAVADCDRTS